MSSKLSLHVKPGQLWHNVRSGRNEFALVAGVTRLSDDRGCRVLHYDERGNLVVLDTQRTDVPMWKKAGWVLISRARTNWRQAP